MPHLTGVHAVRAVIQRIERAKVSVEGREVSATGAGLLVFFGVEAGDGEGDADFLAEKIVHLRIFEDHDGKMNRSLKDVNGQMLVVSQFTLLGDCRKGRRPSFGRAEAPERAHALYDHFIRCVAKRGIDAAAGIFQAMMKVELVNDGPVTLLLDTRASSGSGRDGNLDRT